MLNFIRQNHCRTLFIYLCFLLFALLIPPVDNNQPILSYDIKNTTHIHLTEAILGATAICIHHHKCGFQLRYVEHRKMYTCC